MFADAAIGTIVGDGHDRLRWAAKVTESPDRPDRFGCGAVALTVYCALVTIVLILLVVMANPGWQRALQDFFAQQQAQQNSGPGQGQGNAGAGQGLGNGAGQGQGNANNVADRPIPEVSDRYYDSGDASTTVTGPFSLTDQIAIDPVASYSQDGLSWISFNDGGDAEILVVFGEPENSVTVAQGTNVAIGRDDACNFDITVTASSVSGSISCAAADVMNGSEPSGQTVRIELQFSTTTFPMDKTSGNGDPGDAPADGETPAATQ
jgi:hypothetical protein